MKNKILVGVDIGGTTVKIAFISWDGEILHKWEIPTNRQNNGQSIPQEIWSSIIRTMQEISLNKQDLVGIGVGAPGFVDTDTGDVAVAVNIGWKDFDLGNQLHKLSQLPVFVDNDANLAALGENWKGAGNLSSHLIAITLGTGVGGGSIANGKIINGVNGTAGEIGHITVEPGGSPCNCGRRGCLETVASATGIARLATDLVQKDNETILHDYFQKNGELTSKDVFDASREGDKASQELIDYVADVLGLAIANAATVINPSKVVIGGGVSKAGDLLLTPLRKAFNTYALTRLSEACDFVIAELGNDAGVYGGAFLVRNELS